MANSYSALTSQLVTVLNAGLAASYSGISVIRRHFKPADLPDFTRYCIVVSPHAAPWEERRLGPKTTEYVLKVDVFLLVKDFDPVDALFGESGTTKGLFQLISDTKDVLRASDLGGLIPRSIKTYDETRGPVTFEAAAVQAFDSGEKAFVHRARMLYTAPMEPFCHVTV